MIPSIRDEVLGELRPYIQGGGFCNWEGVVSVQAFSSPLLFWVAVENECSEIPSSVRRAFGEFLSNSEEIKRKALAAVLGHLRSDSFDLEGLRSGGSIEEATYTKIRLIEGADELEGLLDRPHLYLEDSAEGSVLSGLGWWYCAWDGEHGAGVRFEDWDVVDVGDMSVAQG